MRPRSIREIAMALVSWRWSDKYEEEVEIYFGQLKLTSQKSDDAFVLLAEMRREVQRQLEDFAPELAAGLAEQTGRSGGSATADRLFSQRWK